MSDTRVIRYRTKPDRAEENQRLVEAVFAELAESAPAGVRYATLRLDDGVSFVHIVQTDGAANPLLDLPAFQRFQADLADRLEDGPTPSAATVVGSYGVLPG